MPLVIALLALLLTTAQAAADLPADPLDSSMWRELATQFFKSSPVIFDDRVKVTVPSTTENQAQVPVTVDATALDHVVKIMVFADLNPIQHVLELKPIRADAFISFRMKIEQSTPVRAGALTADGTWHVGGVFLNAAGGGCTAPAMARSEGSWSDMLGQAQGRLWRRDNGVVRARFRIRHPMDTGLARDNTPAYFIEGVQIRSESGEVLDDMQLFEPISEDPTFTLDVRLPPADSFLAIDGRDNNGGIYRARILAPWKQSAAGPASGCTSGPQC